MHLPIITPFLCLGLTLLTALPTLAATYYIDYAGGDNAANGLSPDSAWRHAPVDPQATGRPAETGLEPGDTVRFKGGVAYHGSLVIKISGAADAPIVFDGNTDGGWGEGPARLDGGEVIRNWQPVASAEAVGGNPLWQQMVSAEIEVDLQPNVSHGDIVLHRKEKTDRQAPWQRVFLIDGESGLLPVAQQPKPADSFFPDLPRDYFKTPRPLELDADEGRTRIHDPARLAGQISGSLEGAFAGFHAGNNHVYFGRILHHDRKTGSLELPLYKGSTYSKTQYAIYNSPSLITQPGEWAVESFGPDRSRVVLLPSEGMGDLPENIAYPAYQTGISIENAASHLVIQGFLIKRYAGGGGGIAVARTKARSRDIRIEDCEIRNLTGMAGIMLNYCDDIMVRDCHIHHNPGWTVGVFLNRVNRYELSDNRLVKNAGSGIRHYECTQGRITGNTLLDHHGIHSSGMNLYTGSRDILVEDNYLTDIITINRSAERITLRNNIVDVRGRGGFCLAFWGSGNVGGRHIHEVRIENNTFIRPVHTGVLVQGREGLPEPEGLVLRDNIIAAVNVLPEGTVMEGNILLEKPRFPLPPGNQVVADRSKVLIDPDARDYRRVQDGPLPQAGAQP